MKRYYFLIPALLLSLSCNEVTDNTKNKIELTSKYELVWDECLDSNCQTSIEYSTDSVPRLKPIRGKFTYISGFNLNDTVVFYLINDYSDTILMDKWAVPIQYQDSILLYSKFQKSNLIGKYYSYVNLNRNGTVIWTGRDTNYVKK